jgi:hypothetical protein
MTSQPPFEAPGTQTAAPINQALAPSATLEQIIAKHQLPTRLQLSDNRVVKILAATMASDLAILQREPIDAARNAVDALLNAAGMLRMSDRHVLEQDLAHYASQVALKPT